MSTTSIVAKYLDLAAEAEIELRARADPATGRVSLDEMRLGTSMPAPGAVVVGKGFEPHGLLGSSYDPRARERSAP